MQNEIKIAIIGAGPAGIAAALQLHRFGFVPLLFEQDINASLLINAWRVENYLGTFPGIPGIELLQKFRNHLLNDGIQPIMEKVHKLNFDIKKNTFLASTATKIYEADYAIIASGTCPKKLLAIENVQREIKKFTFYSIAPLFGLQNKNLIIIGAGDAAFDFALNLAERNNKTYIINSGINIKALPILQKKVFANKNIIYMDALSLKDISPSENKNLHCFLENKRKNIYIDADYLIAAIGRVAKKDFYTPGLIRNEKKLCSKGFLHLAGDVKNEIYRQVAIAVADGINAAMKIREKSCFKL